MQKAMKTMKKKIKDVEFQSDTNMVAKCKYPNKNANVWSFKCLSDYMNELVSYL